MADQMEYDGQEYDGGDYAAKPSKSMGARGGKKENEHLCKLFVGGLDPRTTEDTLQAHFEKYGEIVDVVIVMDPETLNSRGYGFITFSESYVVDEALKHLPHNIYGKDIDAKRALPRGQNQKSKPESPQTKKLFVGGIKDLTEDDIREAFCPYGDVSKVAIPMDRETSKKRGFAFVEFVESSAAKKAAQQGTILIGETEVTVQKPREKNDMHFGNQGGFGGGRDYYGGAGAVGGYGGGRGGFGGSTSSFGGRGGYGGYGQESSSYGRGRGGYGGAASSYGRGRGGYGAESYGSSRVGYGQDLYSGSRGLYDEESSYGRGGYGETSLYSRGGRGARGSRGGYSGMAGGYYEEEADSDFGAYEQSFGGGAAKAMSFGRGRGARAAPYSGSGGAYRGAAASGYSQGGFGGGYSSRGGYSAAKGY